MANRVILGNPGAGFLFKISRPGFDVLTAGNDNLMFDGINPLMQLVQKGIATVPVGGENTWTYVDVAIADQGFFPLVLIFAGLTNAASIEYLSNAVIRLGAVHTVGASTIPVHYLVTNQRFG
jgi:hypothetical protein